MSYHSNFDKNKCWSCEFFSAHRKLETGIFFGDSVNCDFIGKCVNSYSTNFNHDVREDDWCSKYQKWGVLQSKIEMKKQKAEAERIIREIQKEKEKAEAATHVPKPLTQEEKRELEINRIKREKEYKEWQKQNRIAEQQKKIEKIKKSPIIAGISSGILFAIAFLLGWIPYWYWDFRRESFKRIVEDLYAKGRTIEDPFTYEMYLEGLHAKEMRNSVIWIPLVILAVGIIITIVLVAHAKKVKPGKIKEAQKQLNELQK